MYGAIPDDGLDDTAAFFRVFGTGRHVYIPPGVYNVEDLIVPFDVTLSSTGPDSTNHCLYLWIAERGIFYGSYRLSE